MNSQLKDTRPHILRRPAWFSAAPAPVTASTAADFSAPPADFLPLEEETLTELLGKGEDSSMRQKCFTTPLWPLSVISGEGDMQAAERPTCAFFVDKPPSVPLWLATMERLPTPAPVPARAPPAVYAKGSYLPHIPESPPHQSVRRGSVQAIQKNISAKNHRRRHRAPTPAPCGDANAAPAPSPALGSQTSLSTHQTLIKSNTSDFITKRSEATACGHQPDSAVAAAADDYRSIAVQAHTLEVANDASKANLECRRRGSGAHSEQWVGGARALRDSHVRLVVRQLRHIELLNRAIDGAGADAGAADDASDAGTLAPSLTFQPSG